MKNINSFDEINEIQKLVFDNQWNIILEKFRNLCIRISGIEYVERIDLIDFDEYKDILTKSLLESIDIAEKLSAKAIYFSYDPENHWNSAFLICKKYIEFKNIKKESDEDWASDWLDEVDIYEFDNLYQIYLDSKGFFSKKYIGVNLYLAAKIMKIINEIAQNIDTKQFVVCMYFSVRKNTATLYDGLIRLKE